MDVTGRWVNQNGSTVCFEVDATGVISGYYRSKKGRAADGIDYPITGQLNGELIAFQVDWHADGANLHAITSFSGRCFTDADGKPSIHTMWVLVREFEDATQSRRTQVWNAFLTNADVFVRVPDADRGSR